jgi:hypothetical protein
VARRLDELREDERARLASARDAEQ